MEIQDASSEIDHRIARCSKSVTTKISDDMNIMMTMARSIFSLQNLERQQKLVFVSLQRAARDPVETVNTGCGSLNRRLGPETCDLEASAGRCLGQSLTAPTTKMEGWLTT